MLRKSISLIKSLIYKLITYKLLKLKSFLLNSEIICIFCFDF